MVVAIIFLTTTCALFYWHVNPNAFSDYSISPQSLLSDFGFVFVPGWDNFKPQDQNPFALNKLSHASLYGIYFQTSIKLILGFLSLKECLRIIRSVQSSQTFQSENAISFRKIGTYQICSFFISSFIFVSAQNAAYHAFMIHYFPLIFMLLAFVLAEIFDEGNILLKQNQLTPVK